MKTILILTPLYVKRGSGLEKIAWKLSEKLSKKYKVIHLYSSSYKEYRQESNNIECIGIRNINIPIISFLIQSIKVYFFIKNNKIDLIIDNHGTARLYMLLKRSKRIKVIGITHGTYASLMMKNMKFNSLWKQLLHYTVYGMYTFFERSFLKNDDKIVIMSEYLKKEIIDIYGDNNYKFEIIYNAYDTLIKKPQINDSRSPLKVLFISNSHQVKGIDILEKVAKSLEGENIIFNIIGAPYKNKTHKNIYYLGKIPNEKIFKYTSGSDIFFFPSYREGQPVVIFEAMSAGCIPIISRYCNMDMLENSELKKLISYENDADFYIKTFQFFLKNKNMIPQYKKISLEIIKPYSRENQTNKYLELINKMLN